MSQELSQMGLERQEVAMTTVRDPKRTAATRTPTEKVTVKSRPTKDRSKQNLREGIVPGKILGMSTNISPWDTEMGVGTVSHG